VNSNHATVRERVVREKQLRCYSDTTVFAQGVSRSRSCREPGQTSQPAVILTDGEEAPSRLASRQDPPHLVQRLLPQTVRLHSHVVMGNDERGVR